MIFNKDVIAKKNHCVAAVLEMLLNCYGYNFNQNYITAELCKLTNQDIISFYKNGLILKENTLNSFFANNDLKLKEDYISYNQLYDEYSFEQIIKNKLTQRNFLICGYNYSWLFGNCDKTENHVSIICSINSENDQIMIYDPGPEKYGYKNVNTDKLWYAMRIARGGIWCITSFS